MISNELDDPLDPYEGEGEQEKVFDAGDKKSVKRRKKGISKEVDRAAEEMAAVLATEGGRNVIWRIIQSTGMMESPPGRATDIIRYTGRQDIGRALLFEVLSTDPNAYILMQRSQQQRDMRMKKEDSDG